ncbi:MAG: hypothetical protein NXI16_14110 [Alphaproteobacteria bacterium]|nr:hypothetical protein [Alphaproteobacteria bacterium]
MSPADFRDDTKSLLLSSIDAQFVEIGERLIADVAAAKSSEVPEGFVLYHLKNLQGEPLKDTQTDAHEITLEKIVQTDGYRTLEDKAAELNVVVRVDRHFYSSHPHQVRIFRVLADGW